VGTHVIPLAVSQKEKRRQEGRIWIGFIEAGSGEEQPKGGRGEEGFENAPPPSPWKLFSAQRRSRFL